MKSHSNLIFSTTCKSSGYGEKGTRTGSIPPNAVLVFQLELMKIKLPELTGIRRGLLRK